MGWHIGIWHLVIRNQSKISRGDYGTGRVLYNWSCLDVEVVKHSIAVPASNELDPVIIDAGV